MDQYSRYLHLLNIEYLDHASDSSDTKKTDIGDATGRVVDCARGFQGQNDPSACTTIRSLSAGHE